MSQEERQQQDNKGVMSFQELMEYASTPQFEYCIGQLKP